MRGRRGATRGASLALAAASAVWLACGAGAAAEEKSPPSGWLGEGEWRSDPESDAPGVLFEDAERAEEIARAGGSAKAMRRAAEAYAACATRFPLAPRAEEASVRRARCLLDAGAPGEALAVVRSHLERFPETPHLHALVEIAVEAGERWLGAGHPRTRCENAGRALDAFELADEWLPYGELAARARLGQARAYAVRDQMPRSRRAYLEFLERFARSRLTPVARSELAAVSLACEPERPASGAVLAEARAALRLARTRAQALDLPESVLARIDAHSRRAAEEEAEQLLARARFYRRAGAPQSARFCLERLLEGHPKAACAVEARAALERLGAPGEDRP